ncbi:MAG TPA: asparagine synthase-related protein [Gemmatimonadaceae bacterium]|nr:asparagine synthase-related protein [Gemmatimonadaceae bacterium]
MANFIALVDGDTERRGRFLRRVLAEIMPVESLRIDSVEVGDFAAVWAASDRAPISSTCSDTSAAIIWGDAIPGPGSERLDAPGLLRAWEPRPKALPGPFDGFHAALRYDGVQGLTLGADLLGLFPVYYAQRAGVLLIGSSPELFRHHPFFPARLNGEGLAGILLTHAPFEGRALLAGVRRLRPGFLLRWHRESEPVEAEQYAMPAAASIESGSFREDVDRLDATLAMAIDRHVPRNGTAGVLLSGGRDSRLLAGYLRERGHPLHALTLGAPTDYEVIGATAVARALGCTHRVMALEEQQFPPGAELQAKWEHLGSGFASIHMWGAIAPLRDLPSRCLSGYLREIREVEPMPTAFAELLVGVRHRGIAPATLHRLMRRDAFDGMIAGLERRLQVVYEQGCSVEAQRPWRFLLAHDWRSHAGGVPWKLSFGSWPVLPILDRAVLELLSALPDSSLADRRAQDEILRRRFPDLARLPLDRNSDDTLPLLPSVGQRILHRVRRGVEPIRRRIPRKVERRYYHRVYDVNGPGWRAVRQLAERHRERLASLFDMNVLSELVPGPDTRIDIEHPIQGSFGTKMLIGLMLWSGDHLS